MSTNICVAENPEVRVTGLNFRKTPLALREQFAIAESDHARILGKIKTDKLVKEAVLIGTCNRLEFVSCHFPNESDSTNELFFNANIFPKIAVTFSNDDLDNFVYRKRGVEAVEHVFSVASGVDSLVVGETQITGQMKKAFDVALRGGAVSSVLGRLFSMAFATAKSVRTNTSIGEGTVSISSVARELAQQIFGKLEDASVLIVGAGEIGELTVKHLYTAGVRKFFIANRSLPRAMKLARKIDGVVLSFDQVPRFLADVDIVIGASWRGIEDTFYINQEDVVASQTGRSYRPQFFIDLAVPRNFDQSIDELADVFLYNVDDLQQIVDEHQENRAQAVIDASEIIELEAQKFLQWTTLRKLSPFFGELQKQEVFRQAHIWQLMKQLRQKPISEQQCRTLAGMLEELVRKKESGLSGEDFCHSVAKILSINLAV